ncbi:hypothetical protein VW35_15930 [Devosia soli]|uniref:Uncharacterized protein n=1 Tax=Devosia soli TaxID=361041 RepID=A0A0F5L5Q8_9HYPH|nr:hypothetical protein VW35_15930 [Devosia soli]
MSAFLFCGTIAEGLQTTPFQTLEAERQVGRRRTLLQMDQNFPVITVPIYVAAGALFLMQKNAVTAMFIMAARQFALDMCHARIS